MIRDKNGALEVTWAASEAAAVVRTLNKYTYDSLPAHTREQFAWTSVVLNRDYGAALHKDSTNYGPFVVQAFGDFVGGRLGYFPEDNVLVDRLEQLKAADCVCFDILKGSVLINGNCAHFVEDYKPVAAEVGFPLPVPGRGIHTVLVAAVACWLLAAGRLRR